MTKVKKIKKGLDIPLKGIASMQMQLEINPDHYAVKPTDFRLFNPRLLVKEGDAVLAGTPLMQNKLDERVVLTSPVSGVIQSIVRGDKRLLQEVIIQTQGTPQFVDFGKSDPSAMSREQIIEKLLNSGLWPMLRQRPYAIIANPDNRPRAIYISAFDSAPLAPDADYIVQGLEQAFQTGINAIAKLTEGQVHLNVHAKLNRTDFFLKIQNVQVNHFAGPHPSGNVGVQIHHTDPLNKGEVIWYCSTQDVIAIGRLFLTGNLDLSRVIAIAGSEVKEPMYTKVIAGAQVKRLLANRLNSENVRIISGNVLTGTNIGNDGFLCFYDNMISVIPEGNYYEFFGWAAPGFGKHSMSRTFWSWLTPRKQFKLNTNFHGGLRAFVMNGEYEKVFPFDIYPVNLLKSILVKDIEMMEKLGIYEIAEEDFALCEYVCTSKIESQQIVREGIDLMIKEMN